MSNYEAILTGLRKFYNVNDELQKDLERYSMEETGRTLDQNIELFAEKYANDESAADIIGELDDLNTEPHCISEMNDMYDAIYEFKYL